ncbi:MAG: TonB-dependent receptor, partial [Gammaproteobacteria bacterium]|nr:TonB-dependent receptor [Gammaproteobacteria bacterium]
TETDGIDVVATLPVEYGNGGRTDWSLVFNNTSTDVSRAGPTISNDQTRIREIEEGLPETRYNLSANSFFGDWRILGRVSYFDDWYDSEDGNSYSGKHIVDAEAALRTDNGFTFTLGANNLFDEVPDENPGAASGVGNRYSQFSPFGFNGTMWYLRVQYDMNQ